MSEIKTKLQQDIELKELELKYLKDFKEMNFQIPKITKEDIGNFILFNDNDKWYMIVDVDESLPFGKIKYVSQQILPDYLNSNPRKYTPREFSIYGWELRNNGVIYITKKFNDFSKLKFEKE